MCECEWEWAVEVWGKVVEYPGIVELGLEGDVFAFFLVLGAEDLEFGWF